MADSPTKVKYRRFLHLSRSDIVLSNIELSPGLQLLFKSKLLFLADWFPEEAGSQTEMPNKALLIDAMTVVLNPPWMKMEEAMTIASNPP